MAVKLQLSAFEKYAHEYDLITNAAQREKYHQKEVDALIARFRPRSVLDAGCASGLTAMLFARRRRRPGSFAAHDQSRKGEIQER